MASSSSNPNSKKHKRSKDTSPNERKFSVEEKFDKNHSVRPETERELVAIYINRINKLEEQNRKDQATIREHQIRVDLRNQEIEDIRQRIVGVYNTII